MEIFSDKTLSISTPTGTSSVGSPEITLHTQKALTTGEKSVKTEGGVRRWITFMISDTWFALSLEGVQEILKLPELFKPADQPLFMEGVFTLCGIAVPVVRLEKFLGIPDISLRLETPMLLQRLGDGLIAFPVSEVGEVISESHGFTPMPVQNQDSCVNALLTIGSKSCNLLQWDRVIKDMEVKKLEEIRQKERRRLNNLDAQAGENHNHPPDRT